MKNYNTMGTLSVLEKNSHMYSITHIMFFKQILMILSFSKVAQLNIVETVYCISSK